MRFLSNFSLASLSPADQPPDDYHQKQKSKLNPEYPRQFRVWSFFDKPTNEKQHNLPPMK